MRTQRRNRQRMWYSIPGAQVPVYETDSDGNIIYVEVDGEQVPVKTGEYETGYSAPIEFRGAIFSQLENAIMRAWGSDNSNNYAVLVLAENAKDIDGNEIKLPMGTKLWRTSQIKYKGENVDVSSADYSVEGVMTEELNENSFYLQVLNGSTD